ncbi:class I SAM-dependent methyltransferase [Pseudobacteriovorax antillogorgiicola]|uniref:Uncharacterized protein n=1 Tax=Pseudobacteriovorax antillogorgiicola TaxID=1513793 RepID=A0A1Y6CKW5_9BACT|nr:class I SAM-dependent methyltransferase [Pseudobacteriovorax antillogorgiicola]TCS45411.1 hypothetical protein EDD56_12822 [Pseudobacteriovorax antillogorgiicola]SMF74003.1 hypothetical protein SAMN06296036_12822 [Pseudobacteriovorax antillogorgiicola]
MTIHYRHHRYAGNKGDLWKHFILHEVIGLLNQPARILDCHGGAGYYSLAPGQEWKRGLGEISVSHLASSHWLHDEWFSGVWQRFQERIYWGSWVQLAHLQSTRQLTVCDHNPDVVAAIDSSHGTHNNVTPVQTDSFAWLHQHYREFDFIFMDPAYSLKDGLGDDWLKLSSWFQSTSDSPPSLAWYPLYGPNKPNDICDRFPVSGIEIHWPTTRKSAFVPKGCGLFLSTELLSTALSPEGKRRWQDFAKLLGGALVMRSKTNLTKRHHFGDSGTFA